MQQIYRRLKSHFGMGVLLQICCKFSEHLFLRTRLDGCFCCIPTLRTQSIILCESAKFIITDCLPNMFFSLFVFFTLNLIYINAHYFHRYVVFSYSVCNFQSMKSPVELNSLYSKFICCITWLLLSAD